MLISIGGWTYSSNFAAAAATEASRALFASSAVRLVADLGLDGVDVDWEYPQNDVEAENFVLLLQAVRDALDAYAARHASGYHFLLTIATPAGPTNYNKLRLARLAAVVDWMNLMAYDYSGTWDTHAGHQANLYPLGNGSLTTPFSTVHAVDGYIAAGVPASQIVLGMPAYGRSFAGTDGLGKPFTGPGGGSWEPGVYDYKALPVTPGAEVRTDEAAGATYSYDATARELVSFDTPAMIATKVDWLRQRGLAGAMFWEASGDRADDEQQSLIATSHRGLNAIGMDDTPNQLNFPDSRYDNMRAGMP